MLALEQNKIKQSLLWSISKFDVYVHLWKDQTDTKHSVFFSAPGPEQQQDTTVCVKARNLAETVKLPDLKPKSHIRLVLKINLLKPKTYFMLAASVV